MRPLYVGARARAVPQYEALASQNRRLRVTRYQFDKTWNNVRPRNTHVSLTSEPGCARLIAVQHLIASNRRLRCPRASKSSLCSVSLQLSQHAAAAARPKKNSLWLTPRRSRLSRFTLASTSKTCRGQAFAPVPPLSDNFHPGLIPCQGDE